MEKSVIALRNVTTAFLENQGDLLLLHRGEHRIYAPGYWNGVGGHLESFELNQPYQACLREIREETGLLAEDLQDLTLRYILLRQNSMEIVQNYIYFGRTLTRDVEDSDEGKLYWIPWDQVLDRKLSDPIRQMLEHAMDHGVHHLNQQRDIEVTPDILVGTCSSQSDRPTLVYSPLLDWSNPY